MKRAASWWPRHWPKHFPAIGEEHIPGCRLDADDDARVGHLSIGGGLNGDHVLNENSVYADDASDRLNGAEQVRPGVSRP